MNRTLIGGLAAWMDLRLLAVSLDRTSPKGITISGRHAPVGRLPGQAG